MSSDHDKPLGNPTTCGNCGASLPVFTFSCGICGLDNTPLDQLYRPRPDEASGNASRQGDSVNSLREEIRRRKEEFRKILKGD